MAAMHKIKIDTTKNTRRNVEDWLATNGVSESGLYADGGDLTLTLPSKDRAADDLATLAKLTLG